MDESNLGAIQANHPFFKGCTKPAMFANVPLIPFLVLTLFLFVGAMWAYVLVSWYLSLFLLIAYFPLYLTMRAISRKDDQRLRQIMLRMRMDMRQRNRRIWGAVSYGPLRFTKRTWP